MGREPQSVVEHIAAHIRPRPAIPAVLVMFAAVLMPALSAQEGLADWHLWLVSTGLLGSAGLAIAAGFCSLAPHVIWTLLAFWAGTLLRQAGFPSLQLGLLYLLVAATAAMFAVQLWRIKTRRFVPTLREI